jgi:hypothetical protein
MLSQIIAIRKSYSKMDASDFENEMHEEDIRNSCFV